MDFHVLEEKVVDLTSYVHLIHDKLRTKYSPKQTNKNIITYEVIESYVLPSYKSFMQFTNQY